MTKKAALRPSVRAMASRGGTFECGGKFKPGTKFSKDINWKTKLEFLRQEGRTTQRAHKRLMGIELKAPNKCWNMPRSMNRINWG